MNGHTFCRMCGKPSGEGHEPWCPSNDEILHNPHCLEHLKTTRSR
jgi:hypothetical protein